MGVNRRVIAKVESGRQKVWRRSRLMDKGRKRTWSELGAREVEDRRASLEEVDQFGKNKEKRAFCRT